jgi:hypothetical protein
VRGASRAASCHDEAPHQIGTVQGRGAASAVTCVHLPRAPGDHRFVCSPRLRILRGATLRHEVAVGRHDAQSRLCSRNEVFWTTAHERAGTVR